MRQLLVLPVLFSEQIDLILGAWHWRLHELISNWISVALLAKPPSNLFWKIFAPLSPNHGSHSPHSPDMFCRALLLQVLPQKTWCRKSTRRDALRLWH